MCHGGTHAWTTILPWRVWNRSTCRDHQGVGNSIEGANQDDESERAYTRFDRGHLPMTTVVVTVIRNIHSIVASIYSTWSINSLKSNLILSIKCSDLELQRTLSVSSPISYNTLLPADCRECSVVVPPLHTPWQCRVDSEPG